MSHVRHDYSAECNENKHQKHRQSEIAVIIELRLAINDARDSRETGHESDPNRHVAQ